MILLLRVWRVDFSDRSKRMSLLTKDIHTQEIELYPQSVRETLHEQVLWLIRLRWLAVVATALMIFVSSSPGMFPIFTKENSRPLFLCITVLFVGNVCYFLLVSRKKWLTSGNNTLMAMIQVEVDLLILTALLHFSGG